MKKSLIIILCLLILQVNNLKSQNIDTTNTTTIKELDTSKLKLNFNTKKGDKKWYNHNRSISLFAATGLIGLGLYTYKDNGFMNRISIHKERNRYMPDFSNKLDDYIQYAPYASVFILDAFGVKSKHKLKRKTWSIATGGLLNLAIIHTLKTSIGETRPDNSSNNAFPSGHTSNAFMAAHVLHKEYGHRSPYYSVAGYTLASTTGVFRQLNNRHWISDVLVGAGLGIAITELAYYINDRIFKDKGINKYTQPFYGDEEEERYSFINSKFGISSLTDEFSYDNDELTSKRGYSVGFEGAYFFNKYFGLGGEIKFQSYPLKMADDITEDADRSGVEIEVMSIGSFSALVGPFLQYPVHNSIIGTKLLVGTSKGSNTELNMYNKSDVNKTNKITYMSITPGAVSFSVIAGVYFKQRISKTLTLGIFTDFSSSDLKYSIKNVENIDDDSIEYNNENIEIDFNSYTVGISVDIKL